MARPGEISQITTEISYEIEVKDGILYLKFMSEGHETKTFTKNLISSEYLEVSSFPKQV